jgi:hypothetical protein
LPEADEVKESLSLFHAHEKVHIAVRAGFTSTNGAEHTHVVSAVLGGDT